MRTAISFFLILNLAITYLPSDGLAEAIEQTISHEALASEIPEFGQIDDFLYRGAQPSEKGIELLKAYGIKTIINFRHEAPEVEKEKAFAESLGLNYVSIPWRIQRHPKDPVMNQFLEVIGDAKNAPFFLHCRRGAERTGVADALYRYYFQNLSRKEAWDKAMDGYNTLFYWRPFIRKRVSDFYRDLGPRNQLQPQKPIKEIHAAQPR